MGEVFELTEDDVLYTCLPLFHTNALNAFVQALVAGATYHLGPRFSASRFWTRVAEAGATVTYVLGAMVNILIVAARGPRGSRPLGAGGAGAGDAAGPLRPLRRALRAELLEGYGSTETNGALVSNWREQRAGFMGPAREGFEAIVADDEDGEVPDGVDGELLLRDGPPFAFATGYFGSRRRRSRRGGTSGSTPATASSATRRLVPLRRPGQGHDPQARGEHLLVRGRAGAAQRTRR